MYIPISYSSGQDCAASTAFLALRQLTFAVYAPFALASLLAFIGLFLKQRAELEKLGEG